MAEDGTDTLTEEVTTPPAVDKTFTQADLDRIVQDRINRERTKFADYDDLKTKASKLDELEAANQSELDKIIARAETAEKAAAEATERARTTAARSAIVTAANAAGAIDIDAVVGLLPSDAVTVGDDGQVTGADEAVRALLESKPYLVGKPPRSSADGGPRGSGDGPKQLSRDDLTSMSADQIEAARKAGQLADLMSGR